MAWGRLEETASCDLAVLPSMRCGQVEQYLTDIINKMRGELREITDRSVKAYPTKARDEWIFDWPSQIILVVNQIYWCLEVEEAFQKLEKGQKDAMRVSNVAYVHCLRTRTHIQNQNGMLTCMASFFHTRSIHFKGLG